MRDTVFEFMFTENGVFINDNFYSKKNKIFVYDILFICDPNKPLLIFNTQKKYYENNITYNFPNDFLF